jgi:hypothetical protein
MKNIFNLNHLKELLFVYDSAANAQKLDILKYLSTRPLKEKEVNDYHECLLFVCAYPPSKTMLLLAQKELERIAYFLKKLSKNKLSKFNDSGLPFTTMITRFSCDILMELITKYQCNIEIDSFEENGYDLNALLNLTLPEVLKQETTAGYDNLELLNHLGIIPKQHLLFLLNEFNKLEQLPLVKDHLWESLKIYLNISSNSKYYSRSFNKIKLKQPFYQNEMLKRFNAEELLKAALPMPQKLSDIEIKETIGIIRKSLLLTMRETDTSTYMNPTSLSLYHLERGVSIALYGLNANRQLPYQSYIGYTAFKNGFPVAYGGSWVFGHTAMFGLNILESYRGGESGYIMCQLLRTYIQSFKLSYIEIENYQFGKDNPDGIKSGAFWFYYRYGFRPIDKKLNTLAHYEFERIKANKNFRSSEKTLLLLSESNIVLNLNGILPQKKEFIFNKVLHMITHDFKGNNLLATQVAIKDFFVKLNLKNTFNDEQKQTLEEIALWAKAFNVVDSEKLNILYKMINTKTKDAFEYNELVKSYFA